tara:strand:+ start:163 stop:840 length:678 start_codon:yes stop_codon:yes gene_type:complete
MTRSQKTIGSNSGRAAARKCINSKLKGKSCISVTDVRKIVSQCTQTSRKGAGGPKRKPAKKAPKKANKKAAVRKKFITGVGKPALHKGYRYVRGGGCATNKGTPVPCGKHTRKGGLKIGRNGRPAKPKKKAAPKKKKAPKKKANKRRAGNAYGKARKANRARKGAKGRKPTAGKIKGVGKPALKKGYHRKDKAHGGGCATNKTGKKVACSKVEKKGTKKKARKKK